MKIDAIDSPGTEVWFKCGQCVRPQRLKDLLGMWFPDQTFNFPMERSVLESIQLTSNRICTKLNKKRLPISYFSRALPGNEGREIFRETKVTGGNHVESVATITSCNDKITATLRVATRDADMFPAVFGGRNFPEVVDKYFKVFHETIGPRVTNALLEAMLDKFKAVRIVGKRAWFLENEHVEKWKLMVSAVKRSTRVSFGSTIAFEQPFVISPSSLDAIRISIEQEVDARAGEILTELSESSFTERQTYNRLCTLQEIHEKTVGYEKILNQTLGACRKRENEVLNALKVGAVLREDSDDTADIFDVTEA